MRNADTLQLTGLGSGHTRTIQVKRGSFELHPGAISYVSVDDEEEARTYVGLHSLERWRYIDHSRSQ